MKNCSSFLRTLNTGINFLCIQRIERFTQFTGGVSIKKMFATVQSMREPKWKYQHFSQT